MLKVKNTHFEEHGTPFFWVGDTAWLLLQKCSLEESYKYLRNRKELGYNVIQTVLISNLPEDESLYRNHGMANILRKEYWEHCQKVVKMAEDMGIYMALLPTWGNMVSSGILNEENAEEYVDFLVKTFDCYDNVIWLLGGDVRGNVGGNTFEVLGKRLKCHNPERLVGYHPFGRTCTIQWFLNKDWLDFHMFQSGHRRYDQANLGVWDDNATKEEFYGEDNWRYVLDALAAERKPVLDGEPSYEGIPKGLHNPRNGFWNGREARRYAYWSVFAGAAGHTYGSNAIMQFHDEFSGKPSYGAREYWYEALHHEGGSQMQHLKALMESVDYTKGHPMDEVLMYGQKERHYRVATFGGEDFLFCYTFSGDEFMVDLTRFHGTKLDLYWFNPQSGVYSYIDTLKDVDHYHAYPAKKDENLNDWVLVIKKVK